MKPFFVVCCLTLNIRTLVIIFLRYVVYITFMMSTCYLIADDRDITWGPDQSNSWGCLWSIRIFKSEWSHNFLQNYQVKFVKWCHGSWNIVSMMIPWTLYFCIQHTGHHHMGLMLLAWPSFKKLPAWIYHYLISSWILIEIVCFTMQDCRMLKILYQQIQSQLESFVMYIINQITLQLQWLSKRRVWSVNL